MRAILMTKEGTCDFEARGILLRAAKELVGLNVDALVLGCTEIPIVLGSTDIGIPLLDSTMTLAQATVRYALERSFFFNPKQLDSD
jgi:aspartate racemase